MRVFNYYLTSGKSLSVKMDERHGEIVLGRFIPDYLLLTYGSPMFGPGMNLIDDEEFNHDCQVMVDCINDNNLDYKDSGHCFEVLNAVIKSHINHYSRIFIGDLLTYTDEMCELMSAMGYSDATIKVLYPNFVEAAVERNKADVKDDAPDPFANDSLGYTPFWQKPAAPANPRSFASTNRYQRLVEMCPPLRTLPKL